MKFMVELRLKPGSTRRAVATFEERGPNRTLGVSLRGAWVDTQKEVIYALVESADEGLVCEASRSWAEVGDCQINPVVDIEQF
jgi:hypothetical protein